MDENKEVNSTDPKREKVRVIPLSAIDDAPDHPFGVRDDDEMAELVESISTFGVINPVIVRKGEGERYELISGHRRKFACAKLGIDTLPVIVRDLSREEAIIFMVDSNLQREHILPSERAKAYKMKMEAIKQQGRRTDLTSGPMVPKLSREQLGESNGECGRQISRYIRLNNLIPELLEDVDMGKIAFRPAVELSYLDVEEQKDLSYYIDEGEATPSLAQAIQMKKLSQAGVLTEERIEAILSEEKPNQKPIIKVPMERIQKYFSPDASVQEIEDMVFRFHGVQLSEQCQARRCPHRVPIREHRAFMPLSPNVLIRLEPEDTTPLRMSAVCICLSQMPMPIRMSVFTSFPSM